MANAIRSAKSASDWNASDLLAYNITISSIPPDEFFRQGADPSLDHIDPAILNSSPDSDDPNISDAVADYLGYLYLATKATQESDIYNFAAETLKLLGFNERQTTVVTRYIIPLTICGDENRVAETDVCLLYRPRLALLVLLQDKTIFKISPEAEVVGEAIAAFQSNNAKREASGLPPLDAMIVPCITMTGTRPTFYLVPVTQSLSDAVILGQYPATQTRVLRCVTTRAHAPTISEGMENLEYRRLALKRLLAFKTLAKSHWEQFLNGF
ncbi:hypothetical protein FPV67DRAFT_1141351 [Lyophyllum atratum]|nr:hypothetical protein FPV67DRAFT_1141351 [Lyophyllum atratum]